MSFHARSCAEVGLRRKERSRAVSGKRQGDGEFGVFLGREKSDRSQCFPLGQEVEKVRFPLPCLSGGPGSFTDACHGERKQATSAVPDSARTSGASRPPTRWLSEKSLVAVGSNECMSWLVPKGTRTPETSWLGRQAALFGAGRLWHTSRPLRRALQKERDLHDASSLTPQSGVYWFIAQ